MGEKTKIYAVLLEVEHIVAADSEDDARRIAVDLASMRSDEYVTVKAVNQLDWEMS